MGEISKYISITKEWDLFQHHSSRSQIALFKQQNNARKMDRNPIVLLLTKVLKRTQLHSNPIRASVITVKSVLSEQRKPGITEIWARAFFHFCVTLFQAQGPRRKKAASLCLRSHLESISKLLCFSCARKFCEEKQYCWHSEFAGAGEGAAVSFNSRSSGQDLSCWLPPRSTAPAQPRLPAAQAPGNKQTNPTKQQTNFNFN